jgi:hypothetical protein
MIPLRGKKSGYLTRKKLELRRLAFKFAVPKDIFRPFKGVSVSKDSYQGFILSDIIPNLV